MECQVGGLQKKPCQKITVVDFSATNFELCIDSRMYEGF